MLVSHLLFGDARTAPAVITPDGAERRVLSHGGGMMLVEFTFPAAGMKGAEHSHPHEQVSYVKSGDITFNLEGHPPQRLREGGTYYVPPNLRHSVETHAPTVLIDAFAPMREDFLK